MRTGRLSVALCTYNGEARLAAQLDSIAAQTRPPDELIACDDRSTDGTRRVLEAFAARSPFPIAIRVNAENLGTGRNFEQAISLCSGDVVALADQDDVWMPRKLEKLEEAFARRPSAGLVFSDAELVDDDLKPLGVGLWERVEFTPKRRAMFDAGNAWKALLARNVVTGATAAFKRAYLRAAVPFPGSWHHDAWIAFVVSLLADIAYVDEPLIRYRQHAAQQIGARERAPLTRDAVLGDNTAAYAREFRRCADAHRRLKRFRGSVRRYDAVEAAVRDRAVYHYLRSRLPKERRGRIRSVAANLCSLRYQRYANGLVSAAKDLWRD